MKEVRAISEVFTAFMLAVFGGAIMDKEPTAAAIYIVAACWLVYKD